LDSVEQVITEFSPGGEGPASDSLPLLLASRFLLGAVEYFKEFRHPMPHATVHISFGTFDVVMEIVAEELYTGDCIFRRRMGEVTREENKRHVTDVLGAS